MDGEIRSIPETHPVEAGRWDVAANGRGPSGVPHDSKEVVWWMDRSGRHWRDRVCDVCSPWFEDPRRRPHASRNAVPGVNDLATTDPALAAEWDADLNGGLRPEDVTRGNRSCVHWIDGRGHRWVEEVNNRSHGNGCPVCSGRKVAQGVNDLATVRPDLAAEWDRESNGTLTPEDVTENSARKVHWICPRGHRDVATVNARSRGLGCPVCAEENRTRRLADAYGSLADTGAPFLSEWASDLNPPGLKPENLRPNSLVKVYWRCGTGHVWRASVHNRWMGSGCPHCHGYTVSFCEKAVAFYLSKAVPTKKSHRDVFLGTKELDMFVPSLRLAVEYDGAYFHQDVEKDMAKDRMCAENGVGMVRVREFGCPPIDDGSTVVQIGARIGEDYSVLDEAIRRVLRIVSDLAGISVDVDVCVRRDRELIGSEIKVPGIEGTLGIVFPELLGEVASPAMKEKTRYAKTRSKRIVGWRCSRCGAEWNASVRSRADPGLRGCPSCGFNPCRERFLREHPDYCASECWNLDSVRQDGVWSSVCHRDTRMRAHRIRASIRRYGPSCRI